MTQSTSPTGGQGAERVEKSEPDGKPADGGGGGLRGLRKRQKQQKTTLGSVVELVIIIVIALGLALAIQAFIVKPYRIPSGSMEPTLKVGQRVLVDRLGGDFSEPHVGEIAVFHPPKEAEKQICGGGANAHTVKYGGAACAETENDKSNVNFIKRIVGGPGDTISIVEGHVIRNGVREKDSYIKPCEPHLPQCSFPTPIKIPPGHWFMMGDNRGESDDSRFWGPVPRSWIIGDAFATYWPIDRIGFL